MTWAGKIRMFRIEPSPYPPQSNPVLDRVCIAILATDWIVFGSMHFSLHDATVRMLPSFLPFKDDVVVCTGIAEVTVGMLMVYGRTRRIAATGSLVLLILFIPAVAHILSDSAALTDPDPASLSNRLWRLLGVPHNVLMAICSLHLLQKPFPDPWETFKPQPVDGWAVSVVAFILLLCNVAGFLAVLAGVQIGLPTATMWMMMCLAMGGLIGFLFGVPRTDKRTRGPTRGTLRSNRNIEAISDWLTKILIGLGLINFKDIGTLLTERSASLARVLCVDANYALALIVYFSVAGFLEGYLLTRMFLQPRFAEA